MLAEELTRKAMDGWKKSSGHNANLLQKRAHEIGIGAAGCISLAGQRVRKGQMGRNRAWARFRGTAAPRSAAESSDRA